MVPPCKPRFLCTSRAKSNFPKYLDIISPRKRPTRSIHQTILTKYREHGSHVIIVLQLHLGESICPSKSIDGRAMLNIIHPCFFVVETTINLVLLILQYMQCNINMDPKETRFLSTIVHYCISVHEYMVWFANELNTPIYKIKKKNIYVVDHINYWYNINHRKLL